MFNLNKSFIKSLVFTGVLYGWMVPTLGLGQVLKSWLPMEMQITDQWQISKTDGDSTAMWEFSTAPSEEINSVDEIIEEPSNTTTSPKTISKKISREEPASIGSENLIASKNTKPTEVKTAKARSIPTITKVTIKPKRSKKTTSKRGRKCSPESVNIKKIGTRSFTLPKKVIRKYSRNWKEAQQLAHLRWSTKNQERQGVKIHHISCKSPLRLSGLEKGDVVVAVNGHSLQKDADLLKVYGRLLVWKKVELKVRRNQRFITVKYTIV